MKLAQLSEAAKKLTLEPLPYARDALEPVLSKEAVIYHYDHLTKGYVDRFNKSEGDPAFNEAGAFLHGIYWSQFAAPRSNNKPRGASLELIESVHNDFPDFKRAMTAAAKTIQGSGWVYLAKNGTIKTIKNHKIVKDVLLPIDMWEHSWALDYKWDKDDYLKKIWQLIDWDVINHRLAGQ